MESDELDRILDHHLGGEWSGNMKEEIAQWAKADREAAVLTEATRYCDDGHYHDEERDLAMLPSERVAELEALKQK